MSFSHLTISGAFLTQGMIVNGQCEPQPQDLYDDVQTTDCNRNVSQKDSIGMYVSVTDNVSNNNVRKSGKHVRKEHKVLPDNSNKPDVVLHAEHSNDKTPELHGRSNTAGYMYSKVIQPSRLNPNSELRESRKLCDSRGDQHVVEDNATLPTGNYSEIRMLENDLYNIVTEDDQ